MVMPMPWLIFMMVNQTLRIVVTSYDVLLHEAAHQSVRFLAETGITGIPNISGSLCVSISIPRFSTMSIIFSAITTGFPSSNNCNVKYRLRSSAEASTTSITSYQLPSLNINCLDTCSSLYKSAVSCPEDQPDEYSGDLWLLLPLFRQYEGWPS